MVQRDDQLGPATSTDGARDPMGKQKHTAAAAVGVREVLRPGWVSRRPAAAPRDDDVQPGLSPESSSKVTVPKAGAQLATESLASAVAYEYDAHTSTIRFIGHDGVERPCSIDELIQELGKEQIWRALDAISIRRASQAAPATDHTKKKPRSIPATADSTVEQLGPRRPAKDKRHPHPTKEVVSPQHATRQSRPLKRKQRHEDSSDSSGPISTVDESFGSTDGGSTPPQGPSQPPLALRSVRIGDEKAVKQYFIDACEAMQQLATKWILKQWIKAVEPNKQSKCPYSENAKRNVKQKGSDGAPVDRPKGLRPSWWPPEEVMRHKEPDHLKKNERMLLFLSLVNACDTEKALQNLDDDISNRIQPWSDLLEASTEDRKNLRTPKEKAGWDIEENRQKWARRSRTLDGVYSLLRKLEDFKNDVIDSNTRVMCIEPQGKLSRSKKPDDSNRSFREDSVVSDATVLEDYEELAQRYSTRICQPCDVERGRPAHALGSAHTSFRTSRDASPENSTVPIRSTTTSIRGIGSASQSFNSQYEPAMQERPALLRQNMVHEHALTAPQMMMNKGLPGDDPFQLSDLRDPLTVLHPGQNPTLMEWSHSQRSHFGGLSPDMIQGQRGELEHNVPCAYDVGPHPGFQQNSSIGAANYGTSGVWQQAMMPQTSFTPSYDGLSAARPPEEVSTHSPQESFYFEPSRLQGPPGMELSNSAQPPGRRPHGLFYNAHWVPHPTEMSSAPSTHHTARMRR